MGPSQLTDPPWRIALFGDLSDIDRGLTQRDASIPDLVPTSLGEKVNRTGDPHREVEELIGTFHAVFRDKTVTPLRQRCDKAKRFVATIELTTKIVQGCQINGVWQLHPFHKFCVHHSDDVHRLIS